MTVDNDPPATGDQPTTATPADVDGQLERAQARIRHLSAAYGAQRDKLLALQLRADAERARAEQLEKTNHTLTQRIEQAAARAKHAAIAEVVAAYWRSGLLADPANEGITLGPLCWVLEAFGGQTNPDELGVTDDSPDYDTIRQLAAL